MPGTTDSHYNDGYWFSFFSQGWYCALGLRIHPNTNTIDGFASVTHNGLQRVLRASRALRPACDDLTTGPVGVQIVEPMRKQRLVVSDNESGIALDIVFEAQSEPFVEDRYQHVKYGVVVNDMMRYTQVCRASGTLTTPDATVAVADWHAIRDHSWGVRSSMGPAVRFSGIERTAEEADERAIRFWVPFDAGDHTGFFQTHEDSQGQTIDFEGRLDFPDGRTVALTGISHQLEYEPGTVRPSGGWWELHGDDGIARRYDLRSAQAPTEVHGFGYYNGWYDGRGPGMYRGPETLEHDVYPTAAGDVRSGPAHLKPEKRMGPTEYPMHLVGPGGSTGMAHLEHHVFGPYEPYGFT